jgi:phosphoglycolate phosphatase
LPELTALAPELIIFDKGGTLLSFHEMWRAWIEELARRLETAAATPLADRLFDALGFDPDTRVIDPQGALALESMASLRGTVVRVLPQAGLTDQAAEDVMAEVWYAPDPVTEARPLVDVPALFGDLRELDVKIGIATMDDRAPTEAVLTKLGALDLVDALVCVDDGYPSKPAPDMVFALCQAMDVEPAKTIVVGDTHTDLQMGRAAGVARVVGVLSGVAPEGLLAPLADLVLPSVAELVLENKGREL